MCKHALWRRWQQLRTNQNGADGCGPDNGVRAGPQNHICTSRRGWSVASRDASHGERCSAGHSERCDAQGISATKAAYRPMYASMPATMANDMHCGTAMMPTVNAAVKSPATCRFCVRRGRQRAHNAPQGACAAALPHLVLPHPCQHREQLRRTIAPASTTRCRHKSHWSPFRPLGRGTARHAKHVQKWTCAKLAVAASAS